MLMQPQAALAKGLGRRHSRMKAALQQHEIKFLVSRGVILSSSALSDSCDVPRSGFLMTA